MRDGCWNTPLPKDHPQAWPQSCPSAKRITRKAAKLTVAQVRLLHDVVRGSGPLFERAAASYILVAFYGRCRRGNLQFVREAVHDFEGVTGFFQLATNFHKTAAVARKVSELIYVLVCSGRHLRALASFSLRRAQRVWHLRTWQGRRTAVQATSACR